jgi:formylglycine-generating enzyme required for sulfatase activity
MPGGDAPEADKPATSARQAERPPGRAPTVEERTATSRPSPEVAIHQTGTSARLTSGIPLEVQDPGLFGDPVTPPKLFRRLRKLFPSRAQEELDLDRMIAHLAETGCLVPFQRPRKELWLDAALVVDRTASSFVWEAAAKELFETLARSGSFRHVRSLDLLADGTLHQGGNIVDPRRLIDAEGRTLILVATDAVADIWHGGKGVELLNLWAKVLPVVLIQWMPERQWDRTAIGQARRRAVFSSPDRSVGRPSAQPSRARPGHRDSRSAKRPAIPITTLDPAPLERWARMLVHGDIAVPGVILPDRPLRTMGTRVAVEFDAERQVRQFDSLSSREARRLIRMLAAVPLRLKIVRFVHASLLPGTGPSVIAEVMLSGLIEQVDHPGEPEKARFAFRPGVAAVLPEGALASDLYDALSAVAKYTGIRFGGKTFEAALKAPDELFREGEGSTVPLDDEAAAFATAAAPILRILGGRYRRLVEILETQLSPPVLAEVLEPAASQGQSIKVEAVTDFTFTATPLSASSSDPPGTVTNSIGMKLVPIPAGEFLMGSPDSDLDADEDEKPQHRVRITRPFYLGIYPVTQAQYQKVMRATPSYFKDQPENPVEGVSWYQAVRFCNRLSKMEDMKPFYGIKGESVTIPSNTNPGYRLPTEAEWEYACRAGSETPYSFGDDPAEMGEYAWYFENSDHKTHPVGKKHPNALGLYDMHGNVWEWCWNGWDADEYSRLAKQAPVDDPVGPSQTSLRVIRGGCWGDGPRSLRSAYRGRLAPGSRGSSLGFRVARGQSG